MLTRATPLSDHPAAAPNGVKGGFAALTVSSHVLMVRARRMAGRRRARRVVVVAVVLLTCLVFAAQFRAMDAARQRWTDTRVVAVARRDLPPGQVVEADSVELREVVSAAVAPAALDEVPLGSVVRYPVAAGEALVARRLAPEGLTGIAALVPDGERAVALPVGPAARPPLQVGDRVDVLAVLPPEAVMPATGPATDGVPAEPDADAETGGRPAEAEAQDPAEPGHSADLGAEGGVLPLVERAVVVDVTEEAVTVAVPAAMVSAVAQVVTQGAVVLTLTGA